MQEQKGALYSGTATKTMGSILVTGGAGFIGSHCCVELLESGYEVIIMDNLFNSKEESVNRIQQITGGDSLASNIQLVFNNARLASRTAVALAKLEK